MEEDRSINPVKKEPENEEGEVSDDFGQQFVKVELTEDIVMNEDVLSNEFDLSGEVEDVENDLDDLDPIDSYVLSNMKGKYNSQLNNYLTLHKKVKVADQNKMQVSKIRLVKIANPQIGGIKTGVQSNIQIAKPPEKHQLGNLSFPTKTLLTTKPWFFGNKSIIKEMNFTGLFEQSRQNKLSEEKCTQMCSKLSIHVCGKQMYTDVGKQKYTDLMSRMKLIPSATPSLPLPGPCKFPPKSMVVLPSTSTSHDEQMEFHASRAKEALTKKVLLERERRKGLAKLFDDLDYWVELGGGL